MRVTRHRRHVRRLEPAGAVRIAVATSCVLTMAAGTGASAGSSGARSPRVRCSRSGGKTLAKSLQVKVFASGRRFYSCWLPTRARTTLGPYGAVIPNRPETLAASPVRIDGEYVAFYLEGAYDPGLVAALVISVNARTGHTTRSVQPREAQPSEGGSYSSSIEDVGVAADGAPVYLQREGSPCGGERLAVIAAQWRTTVDSRATRTLDCEAPGEPKDSISHLAVHGQTVSWTHAAVRRSATLP